MEAFCHFQRIRSTVDEREQKQLLMDLDVVMRSSDCPYIVQFYGALFREVKWSHFVTEWTIMSHLKGNKWLNIPFFCLFFSGGLLDLYGTYGYLVRQILQVCIWLIRWCDSRRNIRKNNFSCKFFGLESSLFYPYKKPDYRLVVLNSVFACYRLWRRLTT